MDPNKCLEEMRHLVRVAEYSQLTLAQAKRLADLVDAMDNWLVNCNELPEAWQS
jgi:hypothetical protein